MKLKFDETDPDSTYVAISQLSVNARDMLAVRLIQDYLARGAHFYNDFARKIRQACVVSDESEFQDALVAWRALTEADREDGYNELTGAAKGEVAAMRLLKAAAR